MTRHLVIFISCFFIAAVVTTIVRTSRHQPYGGTPGAQTSAGATSAPVSGTAEVGPQAAPDSTLEATPASTSSAAVPVNTICALCGMPVNPALPTAVYQGKVIGFGCKACPPRFAKEPDTYGPAALANQIVEDK